MNAASRKVQKIYLTLLALNTLAASFIWGINTLFLLDAGLSNLEAFAANAFFTAGLVLFEVPTGVVADLKGRRISYLVGTLTLAVTTLLYLYMWYVSAPFWAWAVASAMLGLGFTFFSGAVEAWLVDALTHSGFKGKLESVFAKGQVTVGIAMLTGSVAGGIVAQLTNLGVPYIIRAGILVVTFVLAAAVMKDIGFKPAEAKHPLKKMRVIARSSFRHGLSQPSIRWVMIAGVFSSGVSIYAFYAMQPYLLTLFGDQQAYGIAGLAAAIVAGAQIAGGLLVSHIGRLFKRRTSVILANVILSASLLAVLGLVQNFWLAILLLVIWGLLFAAVTPVRQAYLNGLIHSKHRATVLSFDSLLGSSGGVVVQPVLGKVADAWSYPASYVASGAIQALAIPFVILARRHKPTADIIEQDPAKPTTNPK